MSKMQIAYMQILHYRTLLQLLAPSPHPSMPSSSRPDDYRVWDLVLSEGPCGDAEGGGGGGGGGRCQVCHCNECLGGATGAVREW